MKTSNLSWQAHLNICNTFLKSRGRQLEIVKEPSAPGEEDTYQLYIHLSGKVRLYAQGYFEYELNSLIREAYEDACTRGDSSF